MSIASQANVNVLNGSQACAFSGGKPSGDNELIKSIPGNALYAATMDVREYPPFGSAFAGSREFWSWGQLSQLYTSSVADTKTFVGNNFLANFPAFKDLGGPLVDDQKKVLKLFGAGTDFGVTSGDNNNNNNSRSYTGSSQTNRIPLVGMSETTTIGAFPDSTCWCRNEWSQGLSIPSNAVTAKFGAYVRVPEDDDFRAKNCGGVYIGQWTNNTYPTEYTINAITVKRSEDSFSFLTGQQELGLISQQQWSGLNTTFPEASDKRRWNDRTNIQSIDYKDSSDYRQFNKIEKTVTLAGSGYGRRMIFSCFFGENQGNLDDSGTPTGAIHFYQPFIQFFDSNGDLISSGPRSAKLRLAVTGQYLSFPTAYMTDPGYGDVWNGTGLDRYYRYDIKSPFYFEIYFDLLPDYQFTGNPTVSGGFLVSGNIAGRNSGSAVFKWDGISDEVFLTVDVEVS